MVTGFGLNFMADFNWYYDLTKVFTKLEVRTYSY